MTKGLKQTSSEIEHPPTQLMCFEDFETKCFQVEHDCAYYCSHLKKLKEVLESGTLDVNTRYESGNTMLHLAATDANSKAMKLLLNNRADPNVRSDKNEIPLFSIFSSKASNERKRECVESLILHGADYSVVNSEGDTIVNVALKNGSFFSLQPIVAHLAWLREVGSPVDETIFHQMSFVRVLKQYYQSCTRHLTEMKLNKIDEVDVNEYQVLTEAEEWIASHMRNPSIVKKFEQHAVASDFYYNSLFKNQICKALKIKRLRLDASIAFRKSVKVFSHSSHLIVDKIICHLSQDDLNTLKCIAEKEDQEAKENSCIF